MGWLLKSGLLVLVLFAAAFSSWMVALAAGAFLLVIVVRGRGRERGTAGGARGPGFLGRLPRDRAAGAALLLLAAVAWAEGGRLSVLVFAALGSAALLHGQMAGSRALSAVEPVEGSVLLRNAVPFKWFALAEVKPARGTLPSLLTGVQEELIVMTGERSAVYVALEGWSATREGAESQAVARMRRIARHLAPLGAYLLPLDSDQACRSLTLRMEREKVEEDGWPASLDAARFDVMVLKTRGGFVEAFGAYTAEADGAATPAVPPARQKPRVRPLFLEALDELRKRTVAPQPDALTSFLASLHSARGEPQGQAVELLDEAPRGSGAVVARALSSPPAEFSRVQLRVAFRVYS